MGKKDKGVSLEHMNTVQTVYELVKTRGMPLTVYLMISDALAMRAKDIVKAKVGKKRVPIDVERLVASGWVIATEELPRGELRPKPNEQVWVLLAYPKKGGGVYYGQGYAIYTVDEKGKGDFFMDVTQDGDLQTRSDAVKQGFETATLLGWRPLPKLPVDFR